MIPLLASACVMQLLTHLRFNAVGHFNLRLDSKEHNISSLLTLEPLFLFCKAD